MIRKRKKAESVSLGGSVKVAEVVKKAPRKKEVVVDFKAAEKRKAVEAVEEREQLANDMEHGRFPELPTSARRGIGEVNPKKGELNGQEWWSWDAVQECNPDTCPIADRCPHLGGKIGNKCRIQLDYIGYVTKVLTTQMQKVTPIDRMKLGFHLMPLYGQLVIFKLVAASRTDPFFETEKGDIKTHPVYREIRQVIATISAVWATIEMSNEKKKFLKDVMNPDNVAGATYEDVCGDSEEE